MRILLKFEQIDRETSTTRRKLAQEQQVSLSSKRQEARENYREYVA